MLNNPVDRQQCWQSVDHLLGRWLEERQLLLVQFCAISQLRPLSETAERYRDQFDRFCETLVDYVSAGHFEIYEQLLAEAVAFGDQTTEASRQLYQVIAATTRVILDFNDHYLEQRAAQQLARGLSQLGAALEERFEAEDRLIKVLHQAHANQVA
ncbi:MAG TPA: sigma D regulator [Pseudomonadales bacterium]|nr:sigma D regulator [Pseudomonadales bacterium]